MRLLILIAIAGYFLSGCATEAPDATVRLASELATYAPKQSEYASQEAFVDALREFISDSSAHDARPRPADYGYLNTAKYLGVLVEWFQQGQPELKPYLQCGDKADVMVAMLAHYGIYGRILNVFREDGLGHMFADWYSQDHGKYIVADPDYNIKYVDANGDSLSLAEIIAMDFADFQPQGPSGTGWGIFNSGGWTPASLRDQGFLDYGYVWNGRIVHINNDRINAGTMAEHFSYGSALELNTYGGL